MKNLLKVGLLLLIVGLIAGCQGVGASKADELATDTWVTEELQDVSSRTTSLEDRAAALDREITTLLNRDELETPAPTPEPIPTPEPPSEAIFTDITPSFFAFDEILFLTNRNVIRGFEDGSFGPSRTITRAQTASMLVRELNLTAPANYEMKATDVSPRHGAYEQLRIVEYHGIMRGTNGHLRPNEGLKRSQMAIVLSQAFKDQLEKPTVDYSFTDITSSYPNFEQINLIAHNGITTEVGKDFRPNELTTRAQFSLFLARTIHEPFRP